MLRKPLVLFALLFVATPLLAQDKPATDDKAAAPPSPIAPRTTATRYRGHAEEDGFSLGAELLTKKQAAFTFTAAVNQCCAVVLVAVYPKKDEPVDVSLYDFALVDEQGNQLRPEEAVEIAARLEDKKNSGTGADVVTTANVGFDAGVYTDPTTGQTVHARGVSTGGGVGVVVGPNDTPPPEVTDREKQVMETELYRKALPELKTSSPVAGYLYFPIDKAPKTAKYHLEYAAGPKPMSIPLPQPPHP